MSRGSGGGPPRLAVVLALAALAPGSAWAAASTPGGASTATQTTEPTTPSTAATTPDDATPRAPTAKQTWVARIVLPVTAWKAPRESSTRLGTVEPQSPWGGTNRLLVLDSRVVDDRRWLLVRLPGRPNANQGWVLAETVDTFPNRWRIEVSRRARLLTVWHDGKAVRRVRVVVGKPATPTPAGTFAIADKLRQPSSGEFVGAWVVPLTAHSNVLQEYDGGDGQVALHGRGGASLNDPLGSARSHGCIRLANTDIAWIAARAEAGTMVRVR